MAPQPTSAHERPDRPRRPVGRVLEDFRKRFSAKRSRSAISGSKQEIYRADTPQDVTSVRAKSSRHGKSTADKWNQ